MSVVMESQKISVPREALELIKQADMSMKDRGLGILGIVIQRKSDDAIMVSFPPSMPIQDQRVILLYLGEIGKAISQ